MDPKEKAEDLILWFLNAQSHGEEMYDARQCAIICVDQIIESQDDTKQPYLLEEREWTADDEYHLTKFKEYWLKVKEELENEHKNSN